MITINGKNVADIVIDNKEVAKIQDATNLKVLWEKGSETDDYFYIENAYDGNNGVRLWSSIQSNPPDTHIHRIEWSKDKVNWTDTSAGEFYTTMMKNERVYFRSDEGLFSCVGWVEHFDCQEVYRVGGNINTLLDYNDPNSVVIPEYCFFSLFGSANSTSRRYNNIIDASNLKLPSSIMSSNCYRRMFSGCSLLTATPRKLPATTLAYYCYHQMFSGCSSISDTPILPATTLAESCYFSMFTNCTGLTTPPALPATTLAKTCYAEMFYNCSSLTTAPVLPATTLVDSCYSEMFYDCTSLNNVTSYADDISARNCLFYWLQNVAQTGTLHNLGSASYPSGVSGIPTGWTEVNS